MGWGDSTDPAPPRSDRRMPANCTVQPCPCVPIKTLSVQSLAFVGDHGVLTDYRKDFKAGGKKFPKPEFDWDRKDDHPVPVSYSMGQTIVVLLTFEVEPANACPEIGDIVGQGPEGISFRYTNHTFTPGINKVTIKAEKPLERKVQVLDFEVLWQAKGISAKFDFFADFTKNTVYVTYDTPYNDTGLDNEVTENRLRWVCNLTNGDSNGHDSLRKIHDFPGFALGATTPDPHWLIATGRLQCECVDLAKFYMLSAEMLGLRTGEVVYLYPKLFKGTKESSNPQDMDTRAVKTSVPPHGEYQSHGNTEFLMFVDTHGGWNRYEACYKFTHPDKAGKMLTRYYAGGAGVYDTKEAVMKDVCKETQWIWEVPRSKDPVRICKNPGPYPAEKWKE
jgi:hypothetical protein